MYFSDKITLRSNANTIDTNGFPVKTATDTIVWANKKSVTRSEFYSANANDINIVQAYEVNAEDWGNQTQVVDGTKVYYIVRAYQKGLGVVELNCSDKAV